MDAVERFWRNVEKTSGCWLWRGGCAANGYGKLCVNYRTVSAHRFAWTLLFGPVPPGKQVCHSCDVRACVRPEHLFLCTQSENLRDMWAKGRGVPRLVVHSMPGERNPGARLTEAEVLEIRSRYAEGGVSLSELARQYGISTTAVHNATTGKSWKHISLASARVQAE